MHFVWLIIPFLVFGSTVVARNIELNDNHEQETIKCCDEKEIFVSVDEGLQILVTIETFNVSSLHYLLVKSGTQKIDGFDGRIFTHYIKSARQYLSMKNKVYIQFGNFSEEESTRKSEFQEYDGDILNDFDDTETPEEIGEFLITVRRFGEKPTTPEPTTTEIPWPTPSIDVPANITVNISGQKPSWYTNSENLDRFCEKVVNMAIEYCKNNNINPTEDITISNVFLDKIEECPINWPNRNKCVQITFRLPLFQDENEENYQLDRENLEMMWLKYSDKYLKPQLSNYITPETSVFITWLIIICATILIFSVVLYIFKKFSHKFTLAGIKKKVIHEEQDNILYTKAPRNDSLAPHPKQIVPGMFESQSQYFDPDANDNTR